MSLITAPTRHGRLQARSGQTPESSDFFDILPKNNCTAGAAYELYSQHEMGDWLPSFTEVALMSNYTDLDGRGYSQRRLRLTLAKAKSLASISARYHTALLSARPSHLVLNTSRRLPAARKSARPYQGRLPARKFVPRWRCLT